MAGSSLYQDDDGSGAITDINVTPFVDVVLVLLVVFIVTAKLIVTRGVEIDKPKAATGGDVLSTLRVSVNKDGELFVNGNKFASDPAAVGRIKEIAASSTNEALALGITINGLAILSETPLPWNPEHTNPAGGLTKYYRDNVIGGPGSFVIEAKDFSSFGQAIIKKMIAEIADARGNPATAAR